MEERVELEAKLAWLEKYVLELDGVIRSLGDEVIELRREVAELRAAAAREGGSEDDDEDAGVSYEKPPHY